MNIYKKVFFVCAINLILLFSSAMAAPGDQDEPIEVSVDSKLILEVGDTYAANLPSNIIGSIENGQPRITFVKEGVVCITVTCNDGEVMPCYFSVVPSLVPVNGSQEEKDNVIKHESYPSDFNPIHALNNTNLHPVKTGYVPCDEAVEQVLSQIITPGMTNEQKVRACYDWLIDNCSYGGGVTVVTDWSVHEYASAASMLRGRVGVCDNYASAFAALTRAIGFNTLVACGETERADGGYTGHAWNVIMVDGNEIVFDTQIDDNIARGGPTGYYRYAKRYDELPGSYIFSGFKVEYPYFE